MAVSGTYLAFQLSGTLPFFRIYRDSILADALAGLENLEQRADSVADAVFKRLGSRPATDDSGDMEQEAEWAHEVGQAYYEAMTGLRRATINLLAAGLYHLVEQQLSKLAFDRKFQDIYMDARNASLGPKAELLPWYKKHFGVDLRDFPQWETIDQLRLVANAVKHADGSSARELRGNPPRTANSLQYRRSQRVGPVVGSRPRATATSWAASDELAKCQSVRSRGKTQRSAPAERSTLPSKMISTGRPRSRSSRHGPTPMFPQWEVSGGRRPARPLARHGDPTPSLTDIGKRESRQPSDAVENVSRP
jgi:hypothetical protein